MRREHADNSYRDRPIWRQWPFIPVPVLFVAIVGLWFVDRAVPHRSPALLIILNLLLAALPALAIAALFARGFLASGAPGLLLFGCGAVFWSPRACRRSLPRWIPASASTPTPTPPSPFTTSRSGPPPCATSPERLCWSAGAQRRRVAASISLPAMASPSPRRACHRDGVGAEDPGVLRSGRRRQRGRQFVLVSTIAALVLTLVLLRPHVARRDNRFLDWFVLALMLLIVGYVGITLQTEFGGMGGWVSRAPSFSAAST